jgi:transcriptional/translational regulatory protein YebC/TACO1
MFSRKAVFSFPTPAMDLDELELSLIDAGLESIEEEEGEVTVYGDYTAFGELSRALEEMGFELTKAALERIANSPVEFTDEQMVDIEKLIDKLEEDEDVQAVYTNIG